MQELGPELRPELRPGLGQDPRSGQAERHGERPWALLLEYDGGPFVGWQRQDGALSVQAVLEDAASRLAKGRAVRAQAAGRTDAGVHAEGQVALLSLPGDPAPRTVRDALNHHMRPHPVVVLRAAPAAPGWSPRFAATSRTYRYRILNRRARPALELGRAWHVERPLDLERMEAGARHLIGRHDFTSFRAAACQAKSPVRTLDSIVLARRGDLIEIGVEARSFLHHQVRNIVGTLRLVGDGRWQPGDVGRALAARDRSAAGPTAPPDGLCLVRVAYPADPFTPPGEPGPSAAAEPGSGQPCPG